MARVIQVIQTETPRGDSVLRDPSRLVTQYWSFDGELLWEVDHWKEHVTAERLEERDALKRELERLQAASERGD